MGTDMRILALDTTGPVIGVALRVGEETRSFTERITRGGETRLVPWARELVAEAGIALADLDGVAVAAGPGAFTGLRVGLATAAGIALAAGIPVWAGSSLESRAWPHRGGTPVLSMLDARKGRVYAALFDADGSVRSGPGDVAPSVAVGWGTSPFRATGEGALVYRNAVEAAGGVVVEDADDPCVHALAALGAQGLAAGEGVLPEQVRPVYLRDADAKPPKRL